MSKTIFAPHRWYFFLLFLFPFITQLSAQTRGLIYSNASPTPNPLDPNGDGYITASGSAFVSDDQIESEVPYIAIPQVSAEPKGDLSTGSNCGPTDIVDNPNTGADGSYYYINDPDGIADSGDELLQFRLRLAKDPGNGAFGFSVLLDTDILFGAEDPNSVAGNPGFEYEIRLKSGGGAGVFVDNVDGTVNGTNLESFSISSNSQRSYALSQDSGCSAIPVFFDFYVTLSSLNLNSNSNFRLIAATASSPGSVLGGAGSDIGGTDDKDPLYDGNQDLIFGSAVEEQGDGLNIDTDGDGISDKIDVDDDNDGLADLEEGYSSSLEPFGDEDGDNILNWEDVVDDGNLGDGSSTDYTDSNNDGIPDAYDTDGDGVVNHLDLDSDNDGINDVSEGGDGALDNNGDGVINNLDTGFSDNNGNGQDDDSESTGSLDSDGDSIPNSVDLDSDNDGILDIVESGNQSADTNGDGVVDEDDANWGDSDADGLPNQLDSDPTNFGDLGDAGFTDDSSDSMDANSGGSGLIIGDDNDRDGIPTPIDTNDAIFGLSNNTLDILMKEFSEIKVFPNPANAQITIQLKDDATIMDIKILTLTGQKITKVDYKKPASIAVMDVSDLSAGAYIIMVETLNQKLTTKLLVD